MTEVAEPATQGEVFPLARSCPFAPPPAYEKLREAGPVQRVGLPDGSEAWAITRLEEVRQMLTDPRFSSNRFNPGFPILTKAGRPQRRRFTASLINMDPPEHGAARREVVGEFTVKRMKALQPRIQQIVDEHIDAILAGPKPADLVSALSLPVPSLVICEQLGVPYADHDFFQSRSSTLLNREVTQEARMQAVEEMQGYLDELVSRQGGRPRPTTCSAARSSSSARNTATSTTTRWSRWRSSCSSPGTRRRRT